MQVRELITLGRFLKKVIQEQNLPNQYQQLINAINEAAQNQNPENVRVHLERLKQIHADIEKQVLSAAQNKLLDDYGAGKLFGKNALERLDRIFIEHQAHPQGLISELKPLLNETNQLAQKANELISALEPMLVELQIDVDEIDENEGRLWLFFADATSINTIEDLENAAETWKQILHHFSRMPAAPADGGRILQINKSSPLELELAANIALLTPLAFGIKWVLSRIEHVIKICQEAEKLKQMKVKSKIVKDLYNEAQEHRKLIAKEAADAIETEYKADNEARNAAEKALNKIIDFIEGGGQLDIDLGDTAPEGDEPVEDEEKSHIQLRELISSIRKDIKLLPPLPSKEEPSTDDTD